ncbi:MAG TPA: adenosine deaminase [Elusimicrobia bacterium]|nr:adenosine deaminase [Elusimicrobiota bacterium]HBT61574.1 adenosine deaminase [Elusimicrobiota bacterium]
MINARLAPLAGLAAAAFFITTPACQADEASAAARFSAAKRSEPELVAFLKGMPKGADLHNHAWGAIYAENMLDFAVRNSFYMDPSSLAFSTQPAAGLVPAKDLLSNRPLAAKFLDAVSMRGGYPGLQSGHDHFFSAFRYFVALLDAMGPDQRLAEVIGRAKDQNVQYLELMEEVSSDSATESALNDPPVIDDMEKALAAMRKRFPALLADSKAYLDARDREVSKLLGINAPVTSIASPIPIRYIFTVPRTWPDSRFFAGVAAGMALMQNDGRVAAVNMLAPEDDPISRRNFESQMRMVDFLWSRLGRPNLTLHAGELTLELSPLSAMRSRIRKTVELGHARRIGHGVSIAWEDDLPGLLREMRQKRVAVEICLTSNEGILKVSGDRHPFNLYRAAGIPLTINTDDEGVNRSNLTMEFVKAARSFDLSYRDLKDLARNSLEYSFLPGESLYQAGDYARLRPEFSGVRALNWRPDARAQALLASSEKLTIQVRLERAFSDFEK